MNRVLRAMFAVLLLSAAVVPAFSDPILFTDDFNRPDGAVGNGWTNTTGNIGIDLLLRNGALTTPGPGGIAGVYRPIDFSAPVTMSATLTQANAFGGALNRYESGFLFGTNGSRLSGYEVVFAHSDQNFANSSVQLQFNGVTVASRPATFQFGAAITPTITYTPIDGRIAGSVTGSGNSFNFDFGPRATALPGLGFGIDLEAPDSRSSVIVNPTLDNLSLSYGNAPPPPVQVVTLGPGLLPPLPPAPTNAPPIGTFLPPSTLISGGSTAVFQVAAGSTPAVSTWITDQVNRLQIQIGSNDLFYPTWLKSNADSIASGIDTTVEGAWKLAIARDFGATAIAHGLKEAAKTGLIDLAEYQASNSSTLARPCSIVGVQTNCTSVLIDGFGIATSGNAYLAALYGNLAMLGDFLAPALRQYGHDPLGLDYTQMYVPSLHLTANLRLTGDAQFDQMSAALLQSSYRASLYLDAINQSFDRYSTAYTLGDSVSALLQLEAVFYYLDLFRQEASINAGLIQALTQLLEGSGLYAVPMDSSWLISVQEQLMQEGFSSDLLAYFGDLGLSSADITGIRESILDFSPADFQAGPSSGILNPLANWMLTAAGITGSVPEGNSLTLLGIALIMLFLVRHRTGWRSAYVNVSQNLGEGSSRERGKI